MKGIKNVIELHGHACFYHVFLRIYTYIRMQNGTFDINRVLGNDETEKLSLCTVRKLKMYTTNYNTNEHIER